ncbi:MAG: ABC transporter permease subunit [Propionibacteriales bacterium]|nr:ABC transporter permease subunit [Propionibacteriales bacterium]
MTDPHSLEGILSKGEPGGSEPGPAAKERSRSLTADAIYELVRNPVFWVAGTLVVIVLTMAVVPGLWANQDPNVSAECDIQLAQRSPSWDRPFGYTTQGCSMWGAVVYGTRNSVFVAIAGTAAIAVIAITLGVIAGFYGRWIDSVLSRITDIFFGLPFILGAIILLTILTTRTVWTISAVITVFLWPQMTRIMRGATIATKQRDFVDAARAVGASNFRIIRKHIIPNSLAPVIVIGTINLGQLIAIESTLTFLGIGFQPPTVSWGLLIQAGAGPALGGTTHLLWIPCAFVVIATLSFILLGDVLRDALDPRMR